MKSRQSTSLIIKAIMLLLALIVMVFVASLAWFSEADRPVNATGVSVQASRSVSFDMAVGFESSVNGYQYTMSQYTNELNIRDIVTVDGVHYDALHDFSPIDVTGDGVTLIRPSMTAKNADIDRNSSVYTTVTPNKEYISFDMYFRSSEPCKVYLDSGSFVKGAIEDEPGDGNLVQTTDTGSNRKAAEGDYSKDAVVGAVRVAFVNYDGFVEGEDSANLKETAELLWLPRPDIHLNSSGATGTWTLSTGLTKENTVLDYIGADGRFGGWPVDTFMHHFYTFVYNEDQGKYVGEDRNYVDTVTDPSRDAICDVSFKNGDYYYGKTLVNIWIEGCDSEARRTIAGGQFVVNFDLAGG
ncbi:MAG: hypothetical protein E7513_01715 [Ruminococcaceae bacterium]|nr:hypothetical protein [Oscillospiraceae bacterium]